MSFKDLNQATDVSTQTSVVNEIIPLTGTFFSGTPYYVKNYINITSGSAVSGGFFSTFYDGSPASVSSSALLDVTFGLSSASISLASTSIFLPNEKQRVYKQMAKFLLGSDSSLFSFNNTNYNELFFLLFKRRIFKDEIKKGSFSMTLQVAGGVNDTLTLTDAGAAGSYKTVAGGDTAPLYSGSTPVGAMFYNAGVAVFATGAFLSPSAAQSIPWSGSYALNQILSGNIDQAVDGFRNRVNQVQFQNQTNLHTTVYFCRALNSEFNYSTNPSFIDSSGRIIPTSGTDNQTRTYITSVGLYDINDNLLAVCKLSAPVRKAPDSEIVVKARLSY